MNPSLTIWARRLVLAGMWTVAIFLAVAFVRRDAFKYVEWTEAVYQRFWPNRGLLALHVVGGGVALLIGPLQFFTALRKRWPRVHRAIGWTYAIAVIGSTPAAVRLGASSCPQCVPPFVVWGTVTFIVTVIAVATAVTRSFSVHEKFMIRSYVLMFGFVFVRLDQHLIGTPLEVPLSSEAIRAPSVLWLSWVVPLMVTELWISWLPALQRSVKKYRALRAAGRLGDQAA